jgi:N-acetylglucosamine-6-phosphate deacetylase
MPTRPETINAVHYRTGDVWAFEFASGKVRARRRVRERAAAVFGPGFVDLQCNGYAGVDFNRKETEPIVIAGAFRAMWERGCTEVLPTVITTSRERAEEFFRDLVVALRGNPEASRSVLGFHLEGPFISPEDGARGAHPVAHTRPVDGRLFRILQRAAEGGIRLLTLAPEVSGALPFIRELRAEKILPALGHTLADAATVRAAADAGALMSTHLGNGCPQMLHRHSNPIIAQLAEARLAASFIADGIHLPPETLRVLWRARGAEQSVLVSDAMAAAGVPPGRYSIGEMEVEVGEDRVVRQPGSPNFAGSALTMDRAVENLVKFAGVPLAEAWDAASTRPWALLRRAGAVRGKPRSEVIARWRNGKLTVLAALRGTKVLWSL